MNSRRGTLRIIAGEFRGRRIAIPASPIVRPTANRVREALFNILGSSVDGARVLDVYSGSGGLGFEALSRGARHVLFVDSDRESWKNLRDNAVKLGVEKRCSVLFGPVAEILRGEVAGGPFDLIFADPPYAESEAADLLPRAAERLAPDGVMVVERGSRAPTPDAARFSLELYRSSAYGRTRLDFYRRRTQTGEGD